MSDGMLFLRFTQFSGKLLPIVLHTQDHCNYGNPENPETVKRSVWDFQARKQVNVAVLILDT